MKYCNRKKNNNERKKIRTKPGNNFFQVNTKWNWDKNGKSKAKKKKFLAKVAEKIENNY